MEEILKVLPIEIKEKVKNKLDGLEEIRIRVNKPVILPKPVAKSVIILFGVIFLITLPEDI